MVSGCWATQVTLHRCGVGQVQSGCAVKPRWEGSGLRDKAGDWTLQ